MKRLFEKYEIKITSEQLDKFERYFNLLVEYNNRFNITAITEKKDVYIKHFIDSINNVDNLSEGKLIDIGSGGGFPAIPLKIMNPKLKVCLVEATGKKCEFLTTVIKELELNDINVINGRAEELAFNENYREKFDYCSARAVARLNILSEYCLPFVKLGGIFISLKGDVEKELEESLNAIKTLGGKVENVSIFSLEEAKRSVVYIKKISNTDRKFPRKNGAIKKKPL